MKKIFSLLGLLMLFCSGTRGAVTPVSEDFSSGIDGWTSSQTGRYTAEQADDNGNKFMKVAAVGNGNNGSVITGTTTNGKAAAGDNFTVSFDLYLQGGNNQTSSFLVKDATNSDASPILLLEQTAVSAATWKVNGDADLVLTLTKNAWYNFVVSVKDGNVYLSVSPNGGDKVLDRKKITALSENGGLGNIVFNTKRYYAGMGIDNVVVRALQDGDVPKGPAYSIRYMLGSTVVKTESGEAPVGEKLTSKGEFWENNVKYFATNGVQEFTNTENPANNIFDVPVREAYNFKYTVHAVAGTVDEVIGSGSVLEGESASVLYSQYINVNGTLYKAEKQSTNPWWGLNVTPTSDNFVKNISYTQAATNIAFYSEAENIAGITAVTNGNANIRCSMGAGGFFEGEKGGTVTTLQPGVYKLYTSVWGNAGMKFTFNAGEKTILEAESKGYIQDYTSEEFVISKPTDITMIGGAAGNNAPKIIDYVYIQKTADFVATEEFYINENEIIIGKDSKMSVTLLPANASNKKVTWKVYSGSNGDSSEVDPNAGEAEIDAEGNVTPIKAGIITVEASNDEVKVVKMFNVGAAEFAVNFTGVPGNYDGNVVVKVGEDESVKDKLYVSTKAGLDNMQNTSLLQPQGSVTATKIPTYIYEITVDKTKKTVDVLYEEDIEVTAMAFEPADQRIAQGNSRTMKVIYTPSNASFKTATWTSSNPEVATVDAKTGYVTAIAEGETTITATWSENESHGTDYSAEMTLTVDKGLVIDRIVFDELDDATAEVMGYYHPMDGDTLFLAPRIESNGRMIPVSFIKQEAFIGSNLKSIVIPGTVKTIDHRALMYSNTHNAYEELPEDGLESAFLMEGVEVMRDRIFHGNKYMKKVFLPSTLTDIGYYSFFGTAIEDVFFGGSEEQWNALKNLENAKLPETAKIHFDSDFTSAFIDGIEVDEENVELEVGEQKAIGFIITPESIAPSVDVTFSSSNEDIATVDETGVITAVADGFATITVSAGAGIEAKVRVKVGDPVQERENVLTMDFEDGEVADYWALAIAESQLVEPTAEGSTGRAAAVVSGSDRGDYVKVNADLEGATKYEVAMDLLLTKSPKTTQFCVLNASSWDTWTTNWGMFWKDTKAQSHNPFLFNMDIPASNTANINIDFDADGNAIAAQQTWDFENGVWYTLTLAVDVNAHTVDYAIAPKSDLTAVAVSGTYTAPADEMMQIKGIYERNGRYNYSPGAIAIDNVIVDVTERGFVEGQGGNGATGISEAQSNESTVKNGKYMENGQIVIYIDGKKFNAAGQQMK